MSHLIRTTDKTEAKCVISIPCKQVVTPKYRQMLRKSLSTSQLAEKECIAQEMVMNKLCEKFAQKELRKLQIENEKNLKKQFMRIKKRLQNTAHTKQSDSEVIKYFEGKDESQNLSSLLKNQSENVEIGIKYQSKLINKLMILKESSEIESNKEKYRTWLDSCNNSPLKSPNFNKMNFVIERVTKSKLIPSAFTNLLNANTTFVNEKQRIRTFKLARASDNSGLSEKIKRQDYSPKSKCERYQRHRL